MGHTVIQAMRRAKERVLAIATSSFAFDCFIARKTLADMTRSGLATQLALAYAIHKSFIFIRVPLTAAVTPKVVKVLRSWGWQIGKRKPKTPKTARASKSSKSS